jgi:predicted nucleic acid-binding protein
MADLVLDASLALAAVLPGERSAKIADAVMSGVSAEGVAVPELWHLEVGNAVLMHVRRQRLPAESAPGLIRRLRNIPVVTDLETSSHAWGETMRLAITRGLTLYDAAYLELAMRLNLPLASLDRTLRRAAEAERVVLANPPA